MDRSAVDLKPRILFVALVNNVGTERVISEMARQGVLCALISPHDFYCAKTQAVTRHFSIPGLSSVWLRALFVHHQLEAAALNWRAQLVLPLDDVAAWLLRSFAVDAAIDPTLRDLLVASFGLPKGYAASVNRLHFMEVASRLGVRKPNQWRASKLATGEIVPQESDFPLLIKA